MIDMSIMDNMDKSGISNMRLSCISNAADER